MGPETTNPEENQVQPEQQAPATDATPATEAQSPVQAANAPVTPQVKDLLKGDANTLSDGTVFEIIELTGADVIKATREIDGKQEMLLPTMMRLACHVNGEIAYFPDELMKMKAKDFLKIMTAFMDVNF